MAKQINREFIIEKRIAKFSLKGKPEIEIEEINMNILARIASKISERLNWYPVKEKNHKVSFYSEGFSLDYEPRPNGISLNIYFDICGLEIISNSLEVLEQIKPIFEEELAA